jgi:hypothetical protein
MPRKAANRKYPPVSLEKALEIATAIQDGASGMGVSRLTLSELVGRSPNASQFRELLLSSRAYGLTAGGVNSDYFELTDIGEQATGADEVARAEALRRAVLAIGPFRTFFTTYNNRKVPSPGALREFLTREAGVPTEWADDCIAHIVTDGRFVGFLRKLKTGEYVDLNAVEMPANGAADDNRDDDDDDDDDEVGDKAADGGGTLPPVTSAGRGGAVGEPLTPPAAPKKVFIAHGKDRVPLEQLKGMLDQFKVRYAVAVDEPNRGRPISAKVANLMRDECSSAIFIFTADEEFARGGKGGSEEVWRPSENVVYELGAASVLYDRRIVIFKDKRVTFPSDFSDLGYIEFEPGQLTAEMGQLFKELVSLDILEVRAKG